MDTRDYAIKFLEERLKEEEEKEHNWKYEIENCLWYLQLGNKCKKCFYGEQRRQKGIVSAGALQCQRCSENYDLLFRQKEV